MTGVFEDHLAVDAIVAFVDGELALTAYQRAGAHIASCRRCADQVAEQEAVSHLLRAAAVPRMPGSLFDSLRSIPVAAPVNPAPTVPGVVRNSAGELRRSPTDLVGHQVGVTAVPPRARRMWFGAGALVAGVAVGALMTASGGAPGPTGSASPTVPGSGATSIGAAADPGR